MIYTSGSTGKPKGAMITYRNIRGVVPGIAERLGLDGGTRHLSYLPLCHVAEQMLTSFVPVYLGSQVHFGESIRTVQEDLREVAPNMFLGVPRIWEKLHAAISIKMQETGPLRRALYRRAMAACAPLAEKPRRQWSLAERLTWAASYWSVLRALQNFIGLREARVALTGAAPIPARRGAVFPHAGRAADRGLRADRIHGNGYRPPPGRRGRGHRGRGHRRRAMAHRQPWRPAR